MGLKKTWLQRRQTQLQSNTIQEEFSAPHYISYGNTTPNYTAVCNFYSSCRICLPHTYTVDSRLMKPFII